MKKAFQFIMLLALFTAMATTAFAGSFPEDLLYEFDAQVFVGNLTDLHIPENQTEIESVTIVPTLKIKGDVAIGKAAHYNDRIVFDFTPETGKQYLFCYIKDDVFYAYEIENIEDTSIKLKLKEHDPIAMAIQQLLDDDKFTKAEEKRQYETGEDSPLSTLIKLDVYTEFSAALKQIVYISTKGFSTDESYEIDINNFSSTTDRITVTDIVDKKMPCSSKSLCITLTGITAPFTSYLPTDYIYISTDGYISKDFSSSDTKIMSHKMNKKDLNKLYRLLPLKEQIEFHYYGTILIYSCFAVAFVIIFATIFIILRKKKNNSESDEK